MNPFSRLLVNELTRHVARGKSVLILGPRQTGKTTLMGLLGLLRNELAEIKNPRERV